MKHDDKPLRRSVIFASSVRSLLRVRRVNEDGHVLSIRVVSPGKPSTNKSFKVFISVVMKSFVDVELANLSVIPLGV